MGRNKNSIILFSTFMCIFAVIMQHSMSEILEQKYGKIIHVSVIFRHGDRTPTRVYPKDPHVSFNWPDGRGQLIWEGKLRLYKLGKWFRERYRSLLRSIDSHTKMRVDSSDMDRTIMSAQCFMAGFYVPNRTQLLSSELLWQPVPIHTSSITDRNFVWINTQCPLLEKCRADFYNSTEMKKKFDKNKRIFRYVEKHSGFKFSADAFYSSIWRLYHLIDTLDMETYYNLTLPSWTREVYPHQLRSVLYQFLNREYSNFTIKRLGIGPLMGSIISDMTKSVDKTNENPVFHFYSGHDDTITPLMFAMRNYNDVNPPYGAALIFELREKGKQHYVTVHYKNSTESEIYQMNVATCGRACTFKQFFKLLQPLVPYNWRAECQKEKDPMEKLYWS